MIAKAPKAKLTCFACAQSHDIKTLATVCQDCGMPLRVGVSLSACLPEDVIQTDIPSLWRYQFALPVPFEDAVTLNEGWTPLVYADSNVWIKDESRNPTGSFKARGITLAVSAAIKLGASRLVVPSAGNAAGALSAYGARVGVPVIVAMPDDTPEVFVKECRHYAAEVHLVAGTISDCGTFLKENVSDNAFNVSTLKEPYRVEGKKTMGYELFEQFGGRLPDVIIYPTGGGTGLIGMWKAFDEMECMGWIGRERPKLISVQAAGCAPVVVAHEQGKQLTTPWPDAKTLAWGLRVPAPLGGFLCLRAIRETNGTAIAISEEQLHIAAADLASATGVDVCPEGGAAWAAYHELRRTGTIQDTDKVVVFNTGTGIKYR